MTLKQNITSSLQPDCSNPCHLTPNLETRERWPPLSKEIFLLLFLTPVSNSMFLFLSFVCVFSLQQTKRIQKNKSNRTKKKKTSHCKVWRAVNTFMARRISFMPAKKTSNALQRLLNELYPYYIIAVSVCVCVCVT